MVRARGCHDLGETLGDPPAQAHLATMSCEERHHDTVTLTDSIWLGWSKAKRPWGCEAIMSWYSRCVEGSALHFICQRYAPW